METCRTLLLDTQVICIMYIYNRLNPGDRTQVHSADKEAADNILSGNTNISMY